jgi:hypothetical protein
MEAQGFDRGVPPSHSSSSSQPNSGIRSSFNGRINNRINDHSNNSNANAKNHRSRQVQSPGTLRDRTNARRNTNYNMSNHAEWKTRSQVDVRLTQVPLKFTTWDIYRLVECYGNVVRVNTLSAIKYNAQAAFVTFR